MDRSSSSSSTRPCPPKGVEYGYLPEYQAARRSAGTVGRAGGGWESERGRQGREEEEGGSGGGGMQRQSGARGIRGCAGEPYSSPSPCLLVSPGGLPELGAEAEAAGSVRLCSLFMRWAGLGPLPVPILDPAHTPQNLLLC